MAVESTTCYVPEQRRLNCRGDWNIKNLPVLKSIFESIAWPESGEVFIDGSAIHNMDSAGAWFLNNWNERLMQRGLVVQLHDLPHDYQNLLTIVKATVNKESTLPMTKKLKHLDFLGKMAVTQCKEFVLYLSFVGELTLEAIRVTLHPKHIRFRAFTIGIYRNGYMALPIIAILSFMIGVVIAYQMGLQLQTYGANIYIVDLLGLSILREFAPLITAIMVAGRTGSAFTAHLGLMKVNQEIDALDTLGVTPAELLILPRIASLVVSLPLLTMWSNIFGVLGGMMMATSMMDITWYDFLERFAQVIPLKSLFIGLGKTPVFALLISSIGCFEGMQVESSAESVGRNTTRSVVLAIFFIIVADALFSVIFSKLKL